MAVYTIQLPDGRKVDIEAADQTTAIRGAQEFAKANPKPDSFWGQLGRGAVRTWAQMGLHGSDIPLQGLMRPVADATDSLAALIDNATATKNGPKPPDPAKIAMSRLQSYTKPPQSYTLADAQATANMVTRAVAAHTGHNPATAGSAPKFGPTTGDVISGIPWVRDQPTTWKGRAGNMAGAAIAAAPVAYLTGGAGAATPLQAATNTAILTGLPAAGAYGAGETARAMKGSPDDVGTAELAGGTLGGLAAGAMVGGPKGSDRILANKTPKMTAAQQAEILDRLQTGQDIGLQPTVTEAIDASVPGARSTLAQQAVEGTKEGINVLGPRMAARPAQAQSVIADVMDQIAPPRPPNETALAAQQGAEAALGQARAGVNEAARPSYDALPNQQIPPDQYQTLASDPSYARALQTFRNNPELSAPYKGLPDNNLAVVNEVQKTLHDMQAQVTPNPANPNSSQQLASIRGNAAGNVDQLASAISGDWANARGTVAQGHREILDPMAAGPLGRVAGQTSPTVESALQALFPNKPLEGQPAVTSDALQSMGAGGQNVGADLVRQYLGRQMAESAQRVAGKPNTFAPSNFSTTVAGNPFQRENLLSGTQAVAPGAVDPLANALDTFDTTGMRQGEGSNTANKLGASAELMSSGKLANAAIGGASHRLLLDRLTGWIDQLRVDMNQKDLVNAINANPQEAAAVLQRIEAARGNSAMQRALLGSLRGGQTAANVNNAQ